MMHVEHVKLSHQVIMQSNELLYFQLNEWDYAWGKPEVATVAVTSLADHLRYIKQLGYSVLSLSWVMEGGAQRGK